MERDLYINILGMTAVQLTLNAYLPRTMRELVVLMSNSATVVAYLKKQGGAVSLDMCKLAQEVIKWSELNVVTITARYISRKNNIQTSQLSYPDQVLSTEWFCPSSGI